MWTCQCDCSPGFCLSANSLCYDGCTTRTTFNPFGGCIPGTDCPWYPEPNGETWCVSTVNVAGQYRLSRTVEQCCEKHFSYLNLDACVQKSEQSVEVAKASVTETAERPKFYYPDLYGRNNCIYWNGYYEWMEREGMSDSYLFSSATDCCDLWYPARTDCPDLSQPTEIDIIGNPSPVKGYWYPNQSESNCRCDLGGEATFFSHLTRNSADLAPFIDLRSGQIRQKLSTVLRPRWLLATLLVCDAG